MARHMRLVREVRREPRVVVPWIRSWLARLWQARGGGFYGLGYVVAFLYFEATSFTGNFSGGATGFLTSQLLQLVLRFSLDSLLNVVYALIWPAWLLQELGGWGVLVLVAGFLGFERLLRPQTERWFPELASARAEQSRAKEQRLQAKEQKRIALRKRQAEQQAKAAPRGPEQNP